MRSLSGETVFVSEILRTSILQSSSLNADFLAYHGRKPDQRLACLESFACNRVVKSFLLIQRRGNQQNMPSCVLQASQFDKASPDGETAGLKDLLRQFHVSFI
jgi:hypothetical protein